MDTVENTERDTKSRNEKLKKNEIQVNVLKELEIN